MDNLADITLPYPLTPPPPTAVISSSLARYAMDNLADITNHSLGNMITEMRIVDQAIKMKRLLTMGGALLECDLHIFRKRCCLICLLLLALRRDRHDHQGHLRVQARVRR